MQPKDDTPDPVTFMADIRKRTALFFVVMTAAFFLLFAASGVWPDPIPRDTPAKVAPTGLGQR